MDKVVRWKQRFQNFAKAFAQLEASTRIANPSDTERAGLIQFFEVSFELAWKTLKDYLESQGFVVQSPREVLKQAYQTDIIDGGHLWMETLEDRNLTTRTYDEATAQKVAADIKEKYFPLLKALHRKLHEEADHDEVRVN